MGWILLVMRICGLQVEWLVMLYNLCGVFLFCVYIIFDTQKILGQWGGHQRQFQIDDYCMAALQLYLDIIELFLFLLRLFGNRRS
eukprot:5437504-Amphidinium_carterae.1